MEAVEGVPLAGVLVDLLLELAQPGVAHIERQISRTAVAAGGVVQESPPAASLSPVRRPPREERSRRAAMSILAAAGRPTNRRRVRNAGGNCRPGVYIVARNTSRGRRVAHVEASITGTVWKIEVSVGDVIEEGDTVVILES